MSPMQPKPRAQSVHANAVRDSGRRGTRASAEVSASSGIKNTFVASAALFRLSAQNARCTILAAINKVKLQYSINSV